MALAFERNQVGVKSFGQNVTVPNDPKAKLMYYLNCMATVLDLEDLPREFTSYSNYRALNDTMAGHLLELCKLMSPDILNGKCIFQVEEMEGSSNKFVELSAAKTTVVATARVMMAGKNVQVAKIMFYKPVWKRTYYDEPIVALERSLATRSRPALTGSRSSGKKKSNCVLI